MFTEHRCPIDSRYVYEVSCRVRAKSYPRSRVRFHSPHVNGSPVHRFPGDSTSGVSARNKDYHKKRLVPQGPGISSSREDFGRLRTCSGKSMRIREIFNHRKPQKRTEGLRNLCGPLRLAKGLNRHRRIKEPQDLRFAASFLPQAPLTHAKPIARLDSRRNPTQFLPVKQNGPMSRANARRGDPDSGSFEGSPGSERGRRPSGYPGLGNADKQARRWGRRRRARVRGVASPSPGER